MDGSGEGGAPAEFVGILESFLVLSIFAVFQSLFSEAPGG